MQGRVRSSASEKPNIEQSTPSAQATLPEKSEEEQWVEEKIRVIETDDVRKVGVLTMLLGFSPNDLEGKSALEQESLLNNAKDPRVLEQHVEAMLTLTFRGTQVLREQYKEALMAFARRFIFQEVRRRQQQSVHKEDTTTSYDEFHKQQEQKMLQAYAAHIEAQRQQVQAQHLSNVREVPHPSVLDVYAYQFADSVRANPDQFGGLFFRVAGCSLHDLERLTPIDRAQKANSVRDLLAKNPSAFTVTTLLPQFSVDQAQYVQQRIGEYLHGMIMEELTNRIVSANAELQSKIAVPKEKRDLQAQDTARELVFEMFASEEREINDPFFAQRFSNDSAFRQHFLREVQQGVLKKHHSDKFEHGEEGRDAKFQEEISRHVNVYISGANENPNLFRGVFYS